MDLAWLPWQKGLEVILAGEEKSWNPRTEFPYVGGDKEGIGRIRDDN